MISTIGRPRAWASCQAKSMTTAPTTTTRATNSGNDSTGCWYLMRAEPGAEAADRVAGDRDRADEQGERVVARRRRAGR